MRVYLLAAAVLGCVIHVNGNANKCDPKVVCAIKKNWGDIVPSNIMEQMIANGKLVVVAATDGYFADNTKCVYAYYHPDGFMFSVLPTKGSAVTTDVNLKEEDGTLVNLETKVVRYLIYNKGGVTALHKCLSNGPDGKAKAVILVRANNFKKENIEEAKNVLKKLGITVAKEYPSKCSL